MSFLGNILGSLGNGILGDIPVIGDLAKGAAAGIQEADARSYQSSENYKNLLHQYEFNKNLQENANAFSAGEAEKTRQWNSIGAQMQRAQAAGVNPAAMLGVTGAGSSQAMASGVSSSVGLPSLSSIPNGIVDLAALSKAFADTKQGLKTGKETSRYDEQIDALLSNYAADISLKKVQKDAQDLANDITRMYGKTRAAYECTKLFEEALMAAANGRKADADARLSDATAALKRSEKKSLDLQIPFIEKRMQAEVDLLLEQQGTEKSKQEENRASAQEHRAGAENLSAKTKTENEVRASVVGISKAEHVLKNYEVRFKSQSNKIALDKLASELRQQLDDETLTAIQKYDAENYSALHRLLFSNERKGEDVGKALKLLSKYSKYTVE